MLQVWFNFQWALFIPFETICTHHVIVRARKRVAWTLRYQIYSAVLGLTNACADALLPCPGLAALRLSLAHLHLAGVSGRFPCDFFSFQVHIDYMPPSYLSTVWQPDLEHMFACSWLQWHWSTLLQYWNILLFLVPLHNLLGKGFLAHRIDLLIRVRNFITNGMRTTSPQKKERYLKDLEMGKKSLAWYPNLSCVVCPC